MFGAVTQSHQGRKSIRDTLDDTFDQKDLTGINIYKSLH